MRRKLCAVALAGLLALAGCSSVVAPGGSDAATPTGSDAATNEGDTPTGDAAADEAVTANGGGSGTVNFYVSDERNAIGDFEHLNVTVEEVSFRRVSNGEGDEETETPEPTGTPESGEAPGPTETLAEADDADGEGDDGDGEWIAREVNATTVDLTELQGENATLLSRFDLPDGTYAVVRLHVAGVEGTLTSGEGTNVKLPSERLRLEEQFAVGDGEAVDFVFDTTVFETGESSKYILKPVASESGTDVPIRAVARGDREGALGARFLGPVNPGEAVTVKVAGDGGPVSGATVEVGDRTYETGSDGTVMFDVPPEAEELEVTVEDGESEAELKRTFDESEDPNEPSDGRRTG